MSVEQKLAVWREFEGSLPVQVLRAKLEEVKANLRSSYEDFAPDCVGSLVGREQLIGEARGLFRWEREIGVEIAMVKES